jgi:hypothetical protein
LEIIAIILKSNWASGLIKMEISSNMVARDDVCLISSKMFMVYLKAEKSKLVSTLIASCLDDFFRVPG